jgi:hypothetical protein
VRPYLIVSGALFAFVALAHFVRAAFGWPIQIAGWHVPLWISWAAFVGAGALSLWAFRLAGAMRR